jgi:3-methyladenine DNA glycosylase AlkC
LTKNNVTEYIQTSLSENIMRMMSQKSQSWEMKLAGKWSWKVNDFEALCTFGRSSGAKLSKTE